MVHIQDDIIRDIIYDPVDCRLAVARHFLGKITPEMPNENSLEHFLLETNIDAFLFFSSSVIDMIKVEINDRFDLFDKENVFYIHGIRKKLADSGIQKQVKDTIAGYFSVPTYKQPDPDAEPGHKHFDATNSSLWELQILRNKATHGKILNIADCRVILEFSIRDPRGKKKQPKYQITLENPERYFVQIFNNLVLFVKEIRLLNPQKTQSDHHRQFDFRLE